MDKALFSSTRQDYCTPTELVELVRKLGPITLDPATNEKNPVGADNFYTPKEDGLSKKWLIEGEYDGVFNNPPYGKELSKWTMKAADEGHLYTRDPDQHGYIIQLTPARPGTKWFRYSYYKCHGLCFLHGRLHFVDPDTGQPAQAWSEKRKVWYPAVAPFPSMLWYYGNDYRAFRNRFAPHGIVIPGGADRTLAII